jgi:hypothetical protein
MYKLSAFFVVGDTYFDLLNRMPSADIGTGEYQTEPFALSTGGMFDALGTNPSYPKGYTLTKTFTIWFATQAEKITYFEDLRGLTGKQGRLYRTWDNDTDIEWVTARLKSVSGERELDHQRHIEVDLSFEIYSGFWHGDYTGVWLLDSGELFDTGLDFDAGADVETLTGPTHGYDITMTGNAPVNDPIITVTAIGGTVTGIRIRGTNADGKNIGDLDYSGSFTSGKQLVIDCGAYTVENDGSDDEANFGLEALHAINDWFRLDPGVNGIVVTWSGAGNPTINFDYYQGHK